MALGLVSCATIPGIKDYRFPHGQKPMGVTHVGGLEEAIDSAAAKGGALHLFLVHGMSNHPFGSDFASKLGVKDYPDLLEQLKRPAWRREKEGAMIDCITRTQFDPLVTRLAGRLKVKPLAESACRLKWIDDRRGLAGYQLRWEFASDAGTGDGTAPPRRLVVHLNSWAFTTIPAKAGLQAADAYEERNAFPFNKALKDGVVTWGLMDAALYVGSERKRMQHVVAKGLEWVGEEDLKSGRFAFGAASLGSVITLDTMAEAAGSLNPEISDALFDGTLPLYLFANQIPLLDPAARRPFPAIAKQGGTAPPRSPVANSLQNFAAQAPRPSRPHQIHQPRGKLTVLAFNDPSDMLGYQVPPVPSKNVDVTVINVTTRNQAIGIWFLGVNPLDAHTGFPKTRAVVEMMVKGIPQLPPP